MSVTTFEASDVPSQAGRTVVITGASSGIGRAAAEVFAARGAFVVLAVRNVAKGRAVADALPGRTEVRRLELGDLASVREFADGLDLTVDILINNAGVMMPPLGRTADGFETQFGTNHLGHFALTNLLLPQIVGRVVTVSSGGHRRGRIDFEDLNWERRSYDRFSSYGQSKLANLLFTKELQRRLEVAGSDVIATAAHPGLADTNLDHSSRGASRSLDLLFGVLRRTLAQTGPDGARPTLYAAVGDIPGNSFAGPRGLLQRGPATLVGRSKAAQDADVARRLWDVSEELTGVRFPLTLTAG
ncbi:oxidoreductase [Kineosporia babensis]